MANETLTYGGYDHYNIELEKTNDALRFKSPHNKNVIYEIKDTNNTHNKTGKSFVVKNEKQDVLAEYNEDLDKKTELEEQIEFKEKQVNVQNEKLIKEGVRGDVKIFSNKKNRDLLLIVEQRHRNSDTCYLVNTKNKTIDAMQMTRKDDNLQGGTVHGSPIKNVKFYQDKNRVKVRLTYGDTGEEEKNIEYENKGEEEKNIELSFNFLDIKKLSGMKKKEAGNVLSKIIFSEIEEDICKIQDVKIFNKFERNDSAYRLKDGEYDNFGEQIIGARMKKQVLFTLKNGQCSIVQYEDCETKSDCYALLINDKEETYFFDNKNELFEEAKRIFDKCCELGEDKSKFGEYLIEKIKQEGKINPYTIKSETMKKSTIWSTIPPQILTFELDGDEYKITKAKNMQNVDTYQVIINGNRKKAFQFYSECDENGFGWFKFGDIRGKPVQTENGKQMFKAVDGIFNNLTNEETVNKLKDDFNQKQEQQEKKEDKQKNYTILKRAHPIQEEIQECWLARQSLGLKILLNVATLGLINLNRLSCCNDVSVKE